MGIRMGMMLVSLSHMGRSSGWEKLFFPVISLDGLLSPIWKCPSLYIFIYFYKNIFIYATYLYSPYSVQFRLDVAEYTFSAIELYIFL